MSIETVTRLFELDNELGKLVGEILLQAGQPTDTLTWSRAELMRLGDSIQLNDFAKQTLAEIVSRYVKFS